ncbi:MAG TPA: hypothetical protein VNQ90_00940 [Chthoniobacteraceae bacterium]|nr:hypothetical protein [Chthoniobacteraceae bacterium]
MTIPSNTLSLPRHESAGADFTAKLRQSIVLACRWITDVAQVKTPRLSHGERDPGYAYDDWRGAIRSQYRADLREWGFFCPYWHSSQAAKALLMAHAAMEEPAFRQGAEGIGSFLLRQRITDPDDPDFGLPLAFEDLPQTVNVSAILEGTEGLFMLSDVTRHRDYERAAIDSLQWVADHSYEAGKGVFRDCYTPAIRRFVALNDSMKDCTIVERSRPLLDDAVYLKAYHRTGNERFLSIFLETAEHLLQTERPPGNWITYGPCNEYEGTLHPRHAYWWGSPMIDAWKETGEERFLAAAIRAAEWYAQALRRDGGFFRVTDLDFNTTSFGHATSGSASAAILFLRLAMECDESRFLPLARKALEFCMSVQFTTPSDPNLKGAVLEKITPPAGSDASPYYLRDLGTIFFVQAGVLALKSEAMPDEAEVKAG